MAVLQAFQILARVPLINADGANDLVPMFGDFTVPAAGLAVNDVVEMVGVPATYVLVDLIIDHDKLGTTMTADVGYLSGNYGSTDQTRTCGLQFIAAADMGVASGVKRPTSAGCTRIAPVKGSSHLAQASGDRGVGFVVKSAAALTPGSVLRFTALYRPQIEGK